MKYLINQTDVYRCDSEKEAEAFLKQLKNDYSFEIISSTMTKKELKQKGEVVDEWIRLTVKKKYNEEKEPYAPIQMYSEENMKEDEKQYE